MLIKSIELILWIDTYVPITLGINSGMATLAMSTISICSRSRHIWPWIQTDLSRFFNLAMARRSLLWHPCLWHIFTIGSSCPVLSCHCNWQWCTSLSLKEFSGSWGQENVEAANPVSWLRLSNIRLHQTLVQRSTSCSSGEDNFHTSR